MARGRKDPVVHSPAPTMTVQEIMSHTDAENLLKLALELITYMPHPYKQELKQKGFFQFGLGEHYIMIMDRKKFNMPVGEYGRVRW